MKKVWSKDELLLVVEYFIMYGLQQLLCWSEPLNEILLPFKWQDIQCKVPNCPTHIAAHLQGTQNLTHKANLAKELQ